MKESLIAGFPDGRLKIWRREQSGSKCSLKAVKMITT